MKKYLLATAAAALIATPAAARDGAGYAGASLGALVDADTDMDLEVTDGTTTVEYDNAFDFDYKLGIDADLYAGYDFGGFRLEGELAYKRAKAKDVEVSDELVADLEDILEEEIDLDDVDIDNKVTVVSAMVNGLADFGNEDATSFFIGGGLGRAWVKALDDSDSAWAWQLIAGVRHAISPNVDLGLKYRYFNTFNLDFDDEFDGIGLNGETKFRSHSLLASLTFNFGSPPAPVEVLPPAPPPPAAPAVQTCADGTVIPATDVCPLPPAPPPPPPPSGERG